MPSPSPKTQLIVWGALVLVVAAVLAASLLSSPPPKPLPVYGDIPDFSLSNQEGRMTSLADWRGHIVLADLIFSRCPGQCLLLDAALKKIQDSLPSSPSVQLISLTCDPGYDTPAVLKKYGQDHGARSEVWSFLTGPKEMLRRLAFDGMKLSIADKDAADRQTPDDLFTHSTRLVLIDAHGKIRGWFDGSTSDSIPSIFAAIQTLALEK